MQTEEVRRFLEHELGVISQKACGSINRTTEKTLAESGMSLESMDVGNGNGSLGASRGRGGVIVSILAGPRH